MNRPLETFGLTVDGSLPFDPTLLGGLRRELDPGERLVWHGRPRPDLARRAAWRVVAPGLWIAGLLGGFLCLGVFMALRDVLVAGEGGIPKGFEGTLVMIGIFALLIGALLWGCVTEPGRAAAKAGRTVYAVTDRRAIVLWRSAKGVIEERDFSPEETRCVLRRELSDGAGDVIFETPRMARPPGATGATPLGFLYVDRCADVERTLRQTLQRSTTE